MTQDWLSIITELITSEDHSTLSVYHQVIAKGLQDNLSTLQNSKEEDIIDALVALGSDFTLPDNQQIRTSFSIGLLYILESLISGNDVETLSKAVEWLARTAATYQLIPLRNYLMSAVIIIDTSENDKVTKASSSINKRMDILLRALEIGLRGINGGILASIVFDGLRYIVEHYLRKEQDLALPTRNSSPSSINVSNFIRLFSAAYVHDIATAEQVAKEIISIKSLTHTSRDNFLLVDSVLLAAEKLTLLDRLWHTLLEHLPSYFPQFAYPQRRSIFQLLSTKYRQDDGNESCRLLLEKVWATVEQEHVFLCSHTDICEQQGFQTTIGQRSAFQATLFISVNKMEVVADDNDFKLSSFVATTLAAYLLQQPLISAAEFSQKLSYLLTCIAIKSILSPEFSRQGILLSIQSHDEDKLSESEDDGDADDSSSNSNSSMLPAEVSTLDTWQSHVISEDELWRWICRPTEVYVPVSESMHVQELPDEMTSPTTLLQLAVERLLCSQYLIQRLLFAAKTFRKHEHYDTELVYILVIQAVVQFNFCRHLVSMAKSIIFAAEKQSYKKAVKASTESPAHMQFILPFLEEVQTQVDLLSTQIPWNVWSIALAFAIQDDPCGRFTATVALVFEFTLCFSTHLSQERELLVLNPIVQEILALLWQYIPLWIFCSEQLRTDKALFKNNALDSAAVEYFLSNSDEESNVLRLDMIERHVVRGSVVKRDDYRCCVLHLFLSISPSLLTTSASIRDPLLHSFLKTLHTTQFQLERKDFDMDINSPPINNQRINGVLHKLRATPTDIAAPNSDMVSGFMSACMWYLQHTTDALFINICCRILEQYMMEYFDNAQRERYEETLWQIQRHMISDYTGIEKLLDIFPIVSYGNRGTRGSNYSDDRITWIEGLYEISWSMVLKTNRLPPAVAHVPPSVDATSSSTAIVSTVQEMLLKDTNMAPFCINALFIRALWEKWFLNSCIQVGKDNVYQPTSTTILGIHLILQDLHKSFDFLTHIRTNGPSSQEESETRDVRETGEKRSAEDALSPTNIQQKRLRRLLSAEEVHENVQNAMVTAAGTVEAYDHGASELYTLAIYSFGVLFPNIHDQLPMIDDTISLPSQDDVSTVTLDQMLEMVLNCVLLCWKHERIVTGFTAYDWTLHIVTTEVWLMIDSWTQMQSLPLSRHIVALAHWTESWINEGVVPYIERLPSMEVILSGIVENRDRRESEQWILVMLLVASALQSSIQWLDISLAKLKPSHHAARKLCIQVQEDNRELWNHIIDMVFQVLCFLEDMDYDDEDVMTTWMMNYPVIGIAVSELCSFKSLLAIFQEINTKKQDKSTRELNHNSVDNELEMTRLETEESSSLSGIELGKSVDVERYEKLLVVYWQGFMKEQILVPWLENDVSSFLSRYKTGS